MFLGDGEPKEKACGDAADTSQILLLTSDRTQGFSEKSPKD